jgi:nucleotide-binding universal stress UspA family protein
VYKRILVAVDGTAASQRALREAVDLATDQRAEIEIVHVVDLTPYGIPELGVPVSAYEEACRAQGRLVLGDATEYARQAGVEARAAMRQRRGTRLSAAIVDEARLFGADLVVLGSESHRGLARWWRGGVAEGVIQGTLVPVLLIRLS